MKKLLISIILIPAFALSQNITNTLGINGEFLIKNDTNGIILKTDASNNVTVLNNLTIEGLSGANDGVLSTDINGKLKHQQGLSFGTTPNTISIAASIIEINTHYVANASDFTILGNTGSGSVTINLPAATLVTGKIYTLKKIHASNLLTISPNSGETIDGQSNKILSPINSSIIIQSTGSKWIILAEL